MSSIHPCVEGEEDEVRTFWEEGYFCEIQQDFKGLQDLHFGTTSRLIEMLLLMRRYPLEKSRDSYMEIDDEEQKAPRDEDTKPSSIISHPL